jgi:hypothetical protein
MQNTHKKQCTRTLFFISFAVLHLHSYPIPIPIPIPTFCNPTNQRRPNTLIENWLCMNPKKDHTPKVPILSPRHQILRPRLRQLPGLILYYVKKRPAMSVYVMVLLDGSDVNNNFSKSLLCLSLNVDDYLTRQEWYRWMSGQGFTWIAPLPTQNVENKRRSLRIEPKNRK